MAQARETEEEVKRKVTHLKDEVEALKEQARERGHGFSSLNEEQLTKKVRGETSKSPFIYAQSWTSGTVAKFAAIVALLVLSLVCPTAAQAGWSGWARCQLEIMGPGYTNTETHDWVVTNVAQGGGRVMGTWIVTGSGELSTSAQLSRWSISSGVSTGQSTEFEVQVSGGQVSIKQTSAPPVTGGIAGYTLSRPGGKLENLSGTQHQWQFPNVVGSITSTELKNPTPPPSGPGNPGWGILRATGSTMSDTCTWWFLDGSTPSSPPSVPSPPVARGLMIAGTPVFRNVLTGNYVYFDANNDPEGNSTFRWLRDGVAIPAATGPNYTLMSADVGKRVSFEVTPVALSGTLSGTPVVSSAVGPVTCSALPTRPTSWVPTSWFQRFVDFIRSRFPPSGTATLADPCP